MIYYYLCAAFALISAIVSFGFSIDAFVKSKNDKGAAFTNALYAGSRSLALLIATVVALFYVAVPYLIAVSIAMICVQLLDGIIGIKVSLFKTLGPIFTAIGNTVFLVLLIVL